MPLPGQPAAPAPAKPAIANPAPPKAAPLPVKLDEGSQELGGQGSGRHGWNLYLGKSNKELMQIQEKIKNNPANKNPNAGKSGVISLYTKDAQNKLDMIGYAIYQNQQKQSLMLSEGRKKKPLTLEEKKAYYKDLDPFFEKQVDKYNKELTNSLKNYVIPEYVKSINKAAAKFMLRVIPKKSKVKDIIKKMLLPIVSEGNKAALAQIKKLAKKEPVKLAEGDDEDYGDDIDDIADQKSNDYVNLLIRWVF